VDPDATPHHLVIDFSAFSTVPADNQHNQ
jgi:hypothetical protein